METGWSAAGLKGGGPATRRRIKIEWCDALLHNLPFVLDLRLASESCVVDGND